MSRLVLLGIVAISMLLITPLVGASSSISVTPNKGLSSLLARTIFDVAEEEVSGEDVVEHRENNREDGTIEERHDDAKRWAENNEE